MIICTEQIKFKFFFWHTQIYQNIVVIIFISIPDKYTIDTKKIIVEVLLISLSYWNCLSNGDTGLIAELTL